MTSPTDTPMNFTVLPSEILHHIFTFISFDHICSSRLVCHRLNLVGRQQLNAGFRHLEKMHERSLLAVKIQLPRRESERRSHPLSRHCDILTAIETRLSLLAMTYNKFIDLDLCCFIPGKVLDEIFSILRLLARSLPSQTQPARPHELLQELRDISSMAMEHFDEQIAPILREKAFHSRPMVSNGRDSLNMIMIGALKSCPGPRSFYLNSCLPSSSNMSMGIPESSGQRLNTQDALLANTKKKLAEVHKRLSCAERHLQEQKRDNKQKLHEYASKFAEMSRKMLEYDTRLNDLVDCIISQNECPSDRKRARFEEEKYKEEFEMPVRRSKRIARRKEL